MNKLSTAKGFTLIELIVVIVILGILAATAAPKFIDLTGDARASVMEGVQGSVNSAADLAHAKALVEGATASAGDSVTMAGVSIGLAYGWPVNADIGLLLTVDADAVSSDGAGAFFHAESNDQTNCRVTYTQPADATSRPAIASVNLDNC